MKLLCYKIFSRLRIVSVLLAGLASTAVISCDDNLTEPIASATSPVLSSSVDGDETIVLDRENSSNTAISFNWTSASNQGTNAGIEYAIQFDPTPATDFSDALSIVLGKSARSKSYTMGDLNTLLVTILGVEVGESQQVGVRVRAVVMGQNLDADYSNSVSFMATTYDPSEPIPPFKKLWIVGGATPRGWNIDNPDSLVRDVTDYFIFRFNEVFTVDEFKIPTATGNWGCDYYMPMTAAGDITSREVQLVPGGSPDFKWKIPTAGAYKITLDLRQTKIDIKPFTPYAQLWLVGDATPAGWNIDNPTPMVSGGDPYTFTYEGPLSVGEFKIPVVTGNWGGDFFMPAVNHQSISETAARFVPGGSPDMKWQIQEAGTYKITFNQLKETIKIEKL